MKPKKSKKKLGKNKEYYIPNDAFIDGVEAFFFNRPRKVPKEFQSLAEFWLGGWDRAQEDTLDH